MVSCDLIGIPEEVLGLVRQEVHKRLPDLDTKKIFLNATHTHTAPVLEQGAIPDSQGRESCRSKSIGAFLAERIAEAIAQAWNGRKPGSVTWGLGHAVVAYNRRAVYADGSAQMYGRDRRARVPRPRRLRGPRRRARCSSGTRRAS